MKTSVLILLSALLLLIALLSILPIHSESLIYDEVLRLHVIANSDSDADQELKLLVRDAILEETQKILKNAKSREEAEKIISEHSALLENIALETVRKNRFDYSVALELGREKYPTKNYESCAFPSGEYLSLRIKIGEASGENWWCVLFPPLCLSAATDKDAFTSVGITDSQYQIITETDNPKYKIRFKLLESFEQLIN
ncbi:MAG: stage II sporulation protein R [Clostridia bacterium]|nr:stage II sporulation protein R [Clostridia bacterium]